MLTDPERALVLQAQALLTQALGAPSTPLISTEAEFDTAYAAAPLGSTLSLAQSFVYTKPLTVDKNITIQGPSMLTGRMTRDEPLPVFRAGLTLTGLPITMYGVEVRGPDPQTDCVVITGNNVSLSRCRILGDSTNGGKRGIAANGSLMTISQCYIDDIFLQGQDAQAICSWDMGGGLVIDDCYLSAAAEAVMFGGADSSSAGRMPHDITLSNSTLTKNTAWYQMGAQIKNALEFKAASNVDVHDCIFEFAGNAQGQGNYLIVATVRNQDGNAPWSTISNVRIHHCTGAHAGGIANILGSDDSQPSGTMNEFSITDCQFTDVTMGDPGRLFAFDRGAQHVTLNGITVDGANVAALGYFSGTAPVALVMGGMALPPSTYGWKIDNGGSGREALLAYAPDAQLDATIV